MTNTKLLTLLVMTSLILIALVLVYPQTDVPTVTAVSGETALSEETAMSGETALSEKTALSEADQAALSLGKDLLHAQAAFATLNRQEASNDIKAIVQLGQDTRYYILVRGWTTEYLNLANSRRETNKYKTSESYRLKTDELVKRLQQILRAIDLE